MKTMPEINVRPVYTVELPVLDMEAQYNPFTVEQEKALITALENDNPDDIVRNYEAILRSCLKSDIDWDNLSVVDYVTLVIAIRSKSKGEALNLKKKECAECEKSFEFSINIEESLVYERLDKKKEVVTIADNLALEISPLSYRFLYGLDKVADEMDMYIHTAAHCISKVIWGKDIFPNPSAEELKTKIIRNLTKGNLEDIFKEYGKLVGMHLEFKYVCPSCGHEEEVVVRDFLKSLK